VSDIGGGRCAEGAGAFIATPERGSMPTTAGARIGAHANVKAARVVRIANLRRNGSWKAAMRAIRGPGMGGGAHVGHVHSRRTRLPAAMRAESRGCRDLNAMLFGEPYPAESRATSGL